MRRIVLAILAFGFVALLLIRRSEIGALGAALAAARPLDLAAAAAFQASASLALALLYRTALRSAGVPVRFCETLVTLLASLFASLVVPSAGLAGMALFVVELGRRGHPPGAVSTGFLVAATLDLAALGLLCAVSATRTASILSGWLALGAIVLGTAALALLAAVLAARFAPAPLARFLALVEGASSRVARRIGRRPAGGWALRTAESAAAGAAVLLARPARVAAMLGVALLAHLLAAGCVGTLLAAFRTPLPAGDTLASYALATATWIASPVPQGVGAVEGVLALALGSFGVPNTQGTWVVLGYRGLSFWLPLVIGAVALRSLRAFGPR